MTTTVTQPVGSRQSGSFDHALPGLAKLRHAAEHIEDYGVDSARRRDKTVTRRMLQVARWDEDVLMWLGEELSVRAAGTAARGLYRALKDAQLRVVGADET